MWGCGGGVDGGRSFEFGEGAFYVPRATVRKKGKSFDIQGSREERVGEHFKPGVGGGG